MLFNAFFLCDTLYFNVDSTNLKSDFTNKHWGENSCTFLHFPISILDILISRFFENDMKHVWLHTTLKLDWEV
jgi:hypothetical protein